MLRNGLITQVDRD